MLRPSLLENCPLLFGSTEVMCLSIPLCNRLWRVLSDLWRLEIFLKWKMAVTVTWVKSMRFENLGFFPVVDFAVLILTDKIHLYIPAICNLYSIEMPVSQSQWPRGLRLRSTSARLLRSWVRIPPGAWMFICCECCVLSSRGLCDELITRPEESYRLWCVVCDIETTKILVNEEEAKAH